MGRIKDWSELFIRVFQGEEFEAVMTEIPYENTEEAMLDGAHVRRHGRLEKLPEEKKYGRAVVGEDEACTGEEYFSKEADRLMHFAEGFEEMVDFFERAQRRYGFEAEDYAVTENALAASEMFEDEEAEKVYSLQGDVREEDGSFFVDSGMKLSRERIGKILDGAVRTDESARKHEIKIEMVSDGAKGEIADVDEMLEEMIERLCAMMTKGADGIYL